MANRSKAKFINQKLEVADQEDIPTNYNVSKFLFTQKTITYDGKTVQLSNVTRISKYNFRKSKPPVFTISDKLLQQSALTVVGLLVALYLLSGIEMISSLLFLGLVISGGIAVYGYNERQKKQTVNKDYYGIIIESASGTKENLLTHSQSFIDRLFNEITKAMNDRTSQPIIANFHNQEIRHIDNSQIEVVLGDNFENIEGSTIINRNEFV